MNEIVTDNPVGHAADIGLAKQMAEALHQAYPGHLWAVTCDGRTGMADIRNLALSGQWGFRLHIHRNYSASYWKHRVVMGGGELLERYRMRRGRFDEDAYNNLPVNRAGNIIGDLKS